MGNADKRTELIVRAAQESGLTVDLLVVLSSGLDDRSLAILLGNVSRLPRYMKSRDIPYLSRSRIAPSMETRNPPLSH